MDVSFSKKGLITFIKWLVKFDNHLLWVEPEFFLLWQEKRAYFFIKKGLPTAFGVLRYNGQLIPEDWSSTEYNMNNAWKFNMNDGNRDWNDKDNNNNYVRPVLAYLVKYIIMNPLFVSNAKSILCIYVGNSLKLRRVEE